MFLKRSLGWSLVGEAIILRSARGASLAIPEFVILLGLYVGTCCSREDVCMSFTRLLLIHVYNVFRRVVLMRLSLII